jgi:hypothetical protein
MYTCYRCGKGIKGVVAHSDPPIWMIRAGIDFSKAFHPSCYEKAEKEAEKELNREG